MGFLEPVLASKGSLDHGLSRKITCKQDWKWKFNFKDLAMEKEGCMDLREENEREDGSLCCLISLPTC
ncbi:hypothetical protein TSUD_187740 [Trifolium subterraneum]|uniref:Uncharacterized protein n=1 Tax=Trifolium subterraneum TaxID=3900 RepID=A0A2Z6P6E2_TRISU|nr:hypothetical protein TSUD_187740 [Trifolium subterraneum]